MKSFTSYYFLFGRPTLVTFYQKLKFAKIRDLRPIRIGDWVLFKTARVIDVYYLTINIIFFQCFFTFSVN